MSIGGGDGYGEHDRTGEDSPTYGHGTARFTTTRTRLPEGEGAPPRPSGPMRPGKSLVTIVGVIVLLLAAIAFANRGGGDEESTGDGGDAKGDGATQPTAPSGEKPVQGNDGKVPSGFPHSKQGAESAAANYAVALGGDGMFDKESRHEIVKSVSEPSALDRLQSGFDSDYSESLNKKIGLDSEGKAPKGSTFVNRTMPAGSKVKSYGGNNATVAVWCSGLFGVAGSDSKNPVSNNWFTVTMDLKWTGDDWRVSDSQQKDGPTPVNSDNPVSGAKDIGKAVEEYGGFTYAR